MENRNFRCVIICLLIIFSLVFHRAVSYSAFVPHATDQISEKSTSNLKQLFEKFLSEHGKVYYSMEEYHYRLTIFEKNLMRARKNQALDPSALHGITQFSDLSEEEFESQYTGSLNVPHDFINGAPAAKLLPVDNTLSSFDWRERGAVSEVKMQGGFSSGWSFSTTGAIEGANFLAGDLLNLNYQQLIDYDHKNKMVCDNGRSGGFITNAYNDLVESGGIQEQNANPYAGISAQYKFRSDMSAKQVNNFTNIGVNENQIAANLVKHGPLPVGLNAPFMQTYIGGVSCPLICNALGIMNHGVLLVGYQNRSIIPPLRAEGRPYWIIKNSWSKRWGEQGYYKLCSAYDEYGTDTMVSAIAAPQIN